jgi:hypothetical protein
VDISTGHITNLNRVKSKEHFRSNLKKTNEKILETQPKKKTYQLLNAATHFFAVDSGGDSGETSNFGFNAPPLTHSAHFPYVKSARRS